VTASALPGGVQDEVEASHACAAKLAARDGRQTAALILGMLAVCIADEFAALLSLALARRVRSGGVVRKAFDNDPLGTSWEAEHRVPALAEPVRAPMLPTVADAASLADTQTLLVGYSTLTGKQAIAVVRAAQQYADALWWADADPRIAWIKLVSAIETAANEWSSTTHPDPVEQLHHLEAAFYAELHKTAPDAIPIVAKRLERQLRATAKFLTFTLEYLPDPPGIRPQGCSLDWATLKGGLRVIYDHRSRDLHDGVPFPEPLCKPPHSDPAGVPCEIFPAWPRLEAAACGPLTGCRCTCMSSPILSQAHCEPGGSVWSMTPVPSTTANESRRCRLRR
jgi:hypothetical protein